MAREGAIEVAGAVVEILPNRMYRVELANGHRLMAFRTGKARLTAAPLSVGEQIWLELSPYDLSRGRIIVETQTV